MKKLLTIALASALAASLLAPSASAQKASGQTVEGSILFPALFAQSAQSGQPFDGCWGGLTRHVTQVGQMQGNGVFGYRFDIDESTWNGKFTLEPTGGSGTVDLDIFMYISMPPAEETATGTASSVDFGTRKEGGETGVVPEGATTAIVCMYGSPDSYGYDATFAYEAKPLVKKKAKKGKK